MSAAIIEPLFLHGGLDACRYWKLGLPDVFLDNIDEGGVLGITDFESSPALLLAEIRFHHLKRLQRIIRR
ncbi:hypothetical protein NW768_003250 [Fusarium equiseti]|uniref:Uncharacterized protein n=1 Tax=Fusarium equiseti TaxID=61235 RepID=A0ABQ8RLK5_FUSEQ|nr:hypothetical protein NW768_003250 [Fusarium equiseti]